MKVAMFGMQGVGKTQFMLNCEKSLLKGYNGYKTDCELGKTRNDIRKCIRKPKKTDEYYVYETKRLYKKDGIFRRTYLNDITWMDCGGEFFDDSDGREKIAEKLLEDGDFKAILLFFEASRSEEKLRKEVKEFENLLDMHDDICSRRVGREISTYVVITKVDTVNDRELEKIGSFINARMFDHGISYVCYRSSTEAKRKTPPIDAMADIIKREIL